MSFSRALTEKIVSVLPRMKCPHRIEPHQIQGLDFIHIFPVVQVRYNFCISFFFCFTLSNITVSLSEVLILKIIVKNPLNYDDEIRNLNYTTNDKMFLLNFHDNIYKIYVNYFLCYFSGW